MSQPTPVVETKTPHIRRRLFIVGGAGLVIGGFLAFGTRLKGNADTDPNAAKYLHTREYQPHAFVRIATDNTVTVFCKHLEFGQGIYTGLATLVAEELDADWAQIKAEGAPANAALYNNLLFGPMQATGGSTSMMNAYLQMREAGATARALLIAAAAKRWQVAASEISIERGVVQHANSQRRGTFGEFAEDARSLPLPDQVRLKIPAEFRLIGNKLPRLDRKSKTDGSAFYTQDVQLPKMLVATVARPERAGQRLAKYDRKAALAVPGVRHVLETQYGVAVLGENTWAAIAGRRALKTSWRDTQDKHFDSREFAKELLSLTEKPGLVAKSDPNAEQAWKRATQVIDLPIATPFLAHVPMEPPNYVMQRTANGVEVWAGEQWQTGNQMALAEYFGIAPEQIKINTLYAGGSFGRRALHDPMLGFVGECAAIVKALGDDTPVKLVYTREDDVQGGWYRPAFCDRVRAGIDADGKLCAWEHRVAGPSIARGTPMEPIRVMPEGFDEFSVEGATTTAYALPAYGVNVHEPKVPFPVLWHRSSGYFGAVLATELGLDAVARASGTDRLALRRQLLSAHPRILAVLEAVVKRANWASPLAEVEGWRRGRGVAAGNAKGTPFAMVCEVRVNAEQAFYIDRLVCAVDCGLPINPDVIRSQIEGGACFGLGMTLHGEITLTEGRVDQSNFHDFSLLRLMEAPPIEIDILPSAEAPIGIGEIATPYVAPALMSALWDANGKRPDSLPLLKAGYQLA
jgi:isoquinoline 1-oxidoreductase beta subunit